MIHDDFPWIIILPDACHRLSRLCGDICGLDRYKDVSSHSSLLLIYTYNITIRQSATYDVFSSS